MRLLCWVLGHKWLDFFIPLYGESITGIQCRRCDHVVHMPQAKAEEIVKTARWYEWGAIPDLEEEEDEE